MLSMKELIQLPIYGSNSNSSSFFATVGNRSTAGNYLKFVRIVLKIQVLFEAADYLLLCIFRI